MAKDTTAKAIIAENICKSLLANMVIEDFSIEVLQEN